MFLSLLSFTFFFATSGLTCLSGDGEDSCTIQSVGETGAPGAAMLQSAKLLNELEVEEHEYDIDTSGFCEPSGAQNWLCAKGKVEALNPTTCDRFPLEGHPVASLTDDAAQMICNAEPNCDGYTRWYNGHKNDGKVRFQKGIGKVTKNGKTKCYSKKAYVKCGHPTLPDKWDHLHPPSCDSQTIQPGHDEPYHVGKVQGPGWAQGVNVYVLDSGLQYDHVEFEGRAQPAIEVKGGHVKECEPNKPWLKCAGDVRGHGTQAAGIIAGKTKGIAPNARLYGVKVIQDDGSLNSIDVFEAFDWVVSKGKHPAVASCSWILYGHSKAIETKIDEAINKGVTVVVSAGNDNEDACKVFPPMLSPREGVLTVGASSAGDKALHFSNHGSCVDLYAPGDAIPTSTVGTYPTSSASTGRSKDDLIFMTGTSAAAPVVSGIVAAAMHAHPEFTPVELTMLVKEMSRKAVVDNAPPYTSMDVATLQGLETVTIPPTPVPTVATPPPQTVFKVLSGDCQIFGEDSTCVTSPNYPQSYSGLQSCEIEPVSDYFKKNKLVIEDFHTENYWDYLTINGEYYSGKGENFGFIGKKIKPKKKKGNIEWSSDDIVGYKGWKLCTTGTRTPAPTTPAPTIPEYHCNFWLCPHVTGDVGFEEVCSRTECRTCSDCCSEWCMWYDWSKSCEWWSCAGCRFCIDMEHS